MSQTTRSQIGEGPTVCIDFKNPKAYLALQPTYALEDELGIVFDWLPLLVPPMPRPPAEQNDEDRGARHRRIRAQYNARDVRRYALVYGLELADLHRNPDASIASIGLLWTKQHSPAALRAYLNAVFERYWKGALSLEDSGAIEALLRDIGVDAHGWSAYVGGEGRELFDRTSAELREAGPFDVPAYAVEGELFFGRQHLPMIRWMLTGKHGEPPI